MHLPIPGLDVGGWVVWKSRINKTHYIIEAVHCLTLLGALAPNNPFLKPQVLYNKQVSLLPVQFSPHHPVNKLYLNQRKIVCSTLCTSSSQYRNRLFEIFSIRSVQVLKHPNYHVVLNRLKLPLQQHFQLWYPKFCPLSYPFKFCPSPLPPLIGFCLLFLFVCLSWPPNSIQPTILLYLQVYEGSFTNHR